MENSNLTITVKAVGIPEAEAQLKSLGATMTRLTVNQNGTVSATGKLTSAMNQSGKATDSAAAATNRAGRAHESYFAHIAKTTVQSALINKLFLEFVDVSGQAIKQVDLMNNFPATMASMGQSTAESSEAFQALSTYVGQVGGNLGDAASAVTRFTGVTKDVKSAVAIYTGLNNALVAGDSTLEEQRLAAIQFAQAFERGKPDMREWLSLTQNMSQQLGIVAKEMGFVNASALGESLRAGETSMADFTTKLTQLSTGTGVIAQQAMARMSGMQFSFNVLKNTMVQGIATIVNTLGRQNIVSFFTFLTQVIQVLTQWVVKLIGWVVSLINVLGGLFGLPAIKLQKDTAGVAQNLNAGAGAAKDMGDGLNDANKEAKKLQKGLASFDKMNVLADKTSGSDKDDDKAGQGTQFDAGQIGALGDVFGDITPKMQEISKWAKIFAGILAGILGTMTLLRGIRWFNDTVDSVKTLSKNLEGMSKNAKQFGDDMKKAFDKGFGKGQAAQTKAVDLGKTVGGGIVSGISGALGGLATRLWPLLVAAFAPIGTAIAGAVAAGAAALGVSVGVFVAIIVAVVAVIVGIIWLIATNWDTIWNFIKTVFTAFWDFLVATWNTLYDIFSGPIKFLLQFVEAIFILVVAIIATALELIFKLVVGTIMLIYNVLAAIAGWIYDNVIKPTADFFVALWDGIVKGVTAAWDWIFKNVLAPIANWVLNNVVNPVINFFKGMWNTITGFVSGFVSSLKGFLSPVINWISNNIIGPISNLFSGLWNGIKSGLSSMIDGLKHIFSGIANIFKSPINGIIDLINSVLRNLNNTVKVPDWVPGLGGKGVNFPMIPRLAKGGVVDKATMAIIGESGSEAVMPLENNTDWIDTLAAKLNERGNNSQPIQLVVQIGEDKVASKVIDLINEKTNMSGRNAIYV